MIFLHHIMERIRQLAGLKGWSYCVLWKLSDENQRFLELMYCCCAGSQKNNNNGGEDIELLFPVSSSVIPCRDCRDVTSQHPRTKACDLLSKLPSSTPLDSGIYAQALNLDRPRWLVNYSNNSHSHLLEEQSVETRVLIPVSVGLIELYVDKEISEDRHMIDFVNSQFNFSNDQLPMPTNSSSIINENEQKEHFQQQPPVSPATTLQNLCLQDDNISDDQIHLHNSSPMNFFQQYHNVAETSIKNLLESANHQVTMDNGMPINPFKYSTTQGFDQEDVEPFQKSMAVNGTKATTTTGNNNNNNNNNCNSNVESLAVISKKRQNEDNCSENSGSDFSDPNDEDDNYNDAKCRRRNGNGKGQAKNLIAERKRRKKLNERLYNLRSLVPKITKLDRASILGDAIEYVLELQQEVTELQNELERNVNVDDEGGANDNQSNLQSEVVHGNASLHMAASSCITGTELVSKKYQSPDTTNDKVQQMEPQVEVTQLDGNELFLKVFCEHKPGGFMKLMEALNYLGLEVTNVNVTSLLSLVLNVFKVKRKDNEMVEADHVREALLELTRSPTHSWLEINKVATDQISSTSSIGNYHQYHH